MSLHPDIAAVLNGDSEGCIVCGECLEIMAEMPRSSVDLLLADPPYGLCEQEGKIQMRGKVTKPDYEAWDAFDITWLKYVPLKPVANAFVFHDQKQATTMWAAYLSYDLTPRRFFFWDKGDSGINPRHNFVNAVEMALFGTKGKKPVWNGGGATINLLRLNRQPTPYHPTQKPMGLIVAVAKILSVGEQVILDPFCGSGTTCVAAKKLGRRWIGIDIDEEYCQTARNRLRDTERPLFGGKE